MTIPRYSRRTYYLIAAFVVFIALLWTAAATRAQDLPEPTSTPTEEPVVPADDAAYIETIDRLGRLIETLLTEGGEAALRQAPMWVLIGILIGVAVAYVITRLTPTPVDDALFDKFFSRLLTLLNIGAITQRFTDVQAVPRTDGAVTTTTTTTVAASAADELTPPDKPVGPVG